MDAQYLYLIIFYNFSFFFAFHISELIMKKTNGEFSEKNLRWGILQISPPSPNFITILDKIRKHQLGLRWTAVRSYEKYSFTEVDNETHKRSINSFYIEYWSMKYFCCVDTSTKQMPINIFSPPPHFLFHLWKKQN